MSTPIIYAVRNSSGGDVRLDLTGKLAYAFGANVTVIDTPSFVLARAKDGNSPSITGATSVSAPSAKNPWPLPDSLTFPLPPETLDPAGVEAYMRAIAEQSNGPKYTFTTDIVTVTGREATVGLAQQRAVVLLCTLRLPKGGAVLLVANDDAQVEGWLTALSSPAAGKMPREARIDGLAVQNLGGRNPWPLPALGFSPTALGSRGGLPSDIRALS